MQPTWNDQNEWIETDGLGGFASGTVGGIRTRRYHGLLLAATNPPTGRIMLVNGLEVFATTTTGAYPLSAQRYDGQIVFPEGHKFVESFTNDPWPTWTYRLPDGAILEQQLFVKQDAPVVAISWKLVAGRDVSLSVRPLLSGRNYHALHRENPNFNFTAERGSGWVCWRPYAPLPGVIAYSNGQYQHDSQWYRNFFYQDEWLRGFDAREDLASPGSFHFDFASATEAVLIFAAQSGLPVPLPAGMPAAMMLDEMRRAEHRRRAGFRTRLERAADQYIVRRGEGKSIIAGYPWFADWGRDTFIALRGLCLATGRLDDARAILVNWARHVKDGLLPNRFPDAGDDEPEYNSVDAALWYVIDVFEFLNAVQKSSYFLPQSTRETLLNAAENILDGYARGTRHGIRLDSDGLIAAGMRGQQLTWMDARVDGREITPRIGKPVEIQALWLNALHLAAVQFPKWRDTLKRGIASFRERFWNPSTGYLNDVVDVDHRPGTFDSTLRPNQIFAVGGLLLDLLDARQARSVVDHVERELLTPLGLRSLAPSDKRYSGRYAGNGAQRDAVYHQGTVWPWLIGAFAEAWVRVRGSSEAAKRDARKRVLTPFLKHLDIAGLGHVSEIADGNAPHMPRGCPFQAWSVAELLRLERELRDLGATGAAGSRIRITGFQPLRAQTRGLRTRDPVGAAE
jgi:predicted glycogen debranching enzyme